MSSMVQLTSGLFVPQSTKALLSGVDDSRGWRVLYDYETSMTAWQKDLVIDRDGVLANWAVFACMTLIAGDIGKCSLVEVIREGQIWARSTKPLPPVIARPNSWQTRQQFMETWLLSKLSWGNTYVLKQRDRTGRVVGLYILDPSRVIPLVSDLGDVFYQLMRDDLSRLPQDLPAVPASEILHDRFNCLYHPLVGLSPIVASGLAATKGLKIEVNSAKFFENMSRPSGTLTAPGAISTETANRLKTAWEANYTGDKMGKTAVLGDGLKYEAIGVNATDSQVVEQLKATAEQICSTFHVPSFKIGAGTIPAGQKVEDLNQIYYADCLHALMDAVQTLLTGCVGYDNETRGVRFDLDDLLKMDAQSQINVIKAGVDAAVMSANEGRAKLNLPPVAGGETPLSQQQYYSLAALAERDRKSIEGDVDVQASAMNGPQVSSLQGLLVAVSLGQMPPDTAAAAIRAAFPLLTEEQVNAMINPLVTFKPEPAEAAAGPVEAEEEPEEESPEEAEERAAIMEYRAAKSLRKAMAA